MSRQLAGFGETAISGRQIMRQPDPFALLSRIGAAGQHHFGQAISADDRCQPDSGTTADKNAALAFGHAEHGAWLGDPDMTGRSDFETTAHHSAAHGSNHRHTAELNEPHYRVPVARVAHDRLRLAAHLLAQIKPSREMATLARQHHRAHAIRNGAEEGLQCVNRCIIDGISLGWPVELQVRNRTLDTQVQHVTTLAHHQYPNVLEPVRLALTFPSIYGMFYYITIMDASAMDQISDIVFTLDAVGAITGSETWDRSAIESVLVAYKDFIDSAVAPGNAAGDRIGCRIEDGRVRLPDNLVQAYQSYIALGWHLLPLPVEQGGIGAPTAVCCAANEMLTGANHAFEMLVALVPGAIKVIERFGTAAQQAALIPDLVAGTALATMCLTEAGAGSDLGAIRTRGVPDGSGGWTLSGEKIFISGGDQDLSETITHLVLARTGALADGTKGLSLFACPSLHPDGTRNTVSLVRIEEKLGLHASPTCQLQFTAAIAQMLGQPGDGLKAMFVMMDHARLDVAMQGVAHAAHAHSVARDYAAQRQQGGKAIADHDDVSRMLDEMEALTLGARAMGYRAAVCLDDADLAAFLTPVCKVFCTDMASKIADLGIQVLGGYGYLPEYGMEQIWRDARVTRLYEGTNGVLAMSLVRRLLGGAAETAFLREIDQALTLASSAVAHDALAAVRSEWIAAAHVVSQSAARGKAAASLMALAGLLYFTASWVRLEAAATDGTETARMGRLGRFVRAALLPDAVVLRIRCQALARADTEDA